MKKTKYIAFLNHIIALVVMGAVYSCTIEPSDFGNFSGGDGLWVIPTVTDATVVTRAASIEELNEKHLNTLDVFVERTGEGKFMNQYHLVISDTDQITDQVKRLLLADYWRLEGLVVNQTYNIYVAVNNTQTRDVKDLTTFDVVALKALKADEITDGLAVVDESTNNIAWPSDKDDQGQYIWPDPSGNIYKQYVDADNAESVKVNGTLYGFTTEKAFMMDDIITGWTPNANSADQVFSPVELNRAAAKIVLNLRFDEDFLHSLTHNKKVVDGTTTWEEKKDAEKFSITGAPGWRFYNFAFGAHVFDPGTNYTPIEVHNSATLLRHPYNFVIDDNLTDNSKPVAAQIITYTYPNKWAATDYASKAPSLVVSVPFLQNGVENPEFHYYRIPLVKNTVTEIKRNHIYVINATIATRGSELHEDVDEIENVYYEVLPWNDLSNSEVIENNVESVQHYYFRVNPKVYTLRGDGNQSVVLNYSKATGTKVNWKLFTYDANGNQTAVVANNATNAVRAWFYDKNGKFTTRYGEQRSNGTIDYWDNMGVTIEQSDEGASGSSGTVTVTSKALTNKGIKYIRLRVYLDEEATFEGGKETMYEDIIIRHFPTDNIQKFDGSWSSRVDLSSSETYLISREYSFNPDADGWSEGYSIDNEHFEISASEAEGLEVTVVEQPDGTETDNNGRSEEVSGTADDYTRRVEEETDREHHDHGKGAIPATSSDYDYYTGQGVRTTNQSSFKANVTTNEDRKNANSENNRFNGYWGVNAQLYTSANTGANADYYTEPVVITNAQYRVAVGRYAYTGVENAQRGYDDYSDWDSEYDGYYYYGDVLTTNGATSDNYVYRTGSWYSGYTYYVYENYYRVQYYRYQSYRYYPEGTAYYKYETYYRWIYYKTIYYKNHYYTTRYVRDIYGTRPGTGNWVDWEKDPKTETDATSAAKITYDGSNFFAKVYYNGDIYPIQVGRTGNTTNRRYYYTRANSQYANIRANTPAQNYTEVTYNGSGLDNNHMYVIQISSTSNEYTLGRPILGNPNANQSQDDVVSPAFMIASQLGAVTTFTGDNTATVAANAANHCRQYLEVAEDGTRYYGWRLPTQSEIKVISAYQNGTINNVIIPSDFQVMTEVLGGALYWCLSGKKIRTSDNQIVEDGTAYLRCVRDLTASEVEELNGFQRIIDKYSTNH